MTDLLARLEAAQAFDQALTLTVELNQVPGYSRESMQRWKKSLETKLHAVLMEDGYAPSDIRFCK